MFCVARRTAAPRPRTDTWTRDSAMAGSFVRTDKTSQDVPQWVRVDQTLFTTTILNLAINARDAMPSGGKLTFDIADVVLDDRGAKGLAPMPPGSYVIVPLTSNVSGS